MVINSWARFECGLFMGRFSRFGDKVEFVPGEMSGRTSRFESKFIYNPTTVKSIGPWAVMCATPLVVVYLVMQSGNAVGV